MLDLFAVSPAASEPGAAGKPETKPPEKILKNEEGVGVPPKNFHESRGNIDQVVDPSKIHPDPCKKVQGPLIPASPTPIKGKYPRVSAMVKPPTEEALRAEGMVVEDADDPRRTDTWRPEWRPKAIGRGRRGWHANINAVHLVESKTQLPKPDVINWAEHLKGRKKQSALPWDEIEPDILNFVAAGGTVTAYCAASGLNRHAALKHQMLKPEFATALAEARKAGADALAAEALSIASTPMMTEERITVFDKNDEIVTKSVKVADNTYARKLAFQARMQLLEKWAPEKYGPNAKAEVSGGMAEKLRAARDRIRTKLKEERRASKPADAS